GANRKAVHRINADAAAGPSGIEDQPRGAGDEVLLVGSGVPAFHPQLDALREVLDGQLVGELQQSEERFDGVKPRCFARQDAEEQVGLGVRGDPNPARCHPGPGGGDLPLKSARRKWVRESDQRPRAEIGTKVPKWYATAY